MPNINRDMQNLCFEEEENEEIAGDYSTFVVRRKEDDDDEEEGMGTMARKRGGGGGGGTMRRTVESMQKVGDIGRIGYGRRRKSGGGRGEGVDGIGIAPSRPQGGEKISSSSIVTSAWPERSTQV